MNRGLDMLLGNISAEKKNHRRCPVFGGKCRQ
ncbi:hypothetical protein E9K_05014 [Moraxella catarrhalis 103P14B1]|nr:hypothetical protein E9K_05014 [Moraxella catarrhalis 103P14B1]